MEDFSLHHLDATRSATGMHVPVVVATAHVSASTKRPEQSRHIKPSPSTMETCVSVGDSSHCQAVHASSCDERTKISSIQNANASDNNFYVVYYVALYDIT